VAQPIEAFRNALKIPELKQRIVFTLMALLVYRLGSHVPTPGVNGHALSLRLGEMGGILNFYNMFSGGAFAQATIFALGIMPNITASIIMSMLVLVIPQLEALHKLGAEGQKKINEYTRYGTIVLCIVQSIAVAGWLRSMNTGEMPILMNRNPGFGFYLMCILSFTTGTAFLMWLGEQISEHGVGNGMSMIIFASIISRMPTAVAEVIRLIQVQELTLFTIALLTVMFVLVIGGTILVTTGQRRIPVQYPRQVKGRKVYGGSRNYLPLRVNQAGVIPIIFASSLLQLPMMLGPTVNVAWVRAVFVDWLSPGHAVYYVLYSALIIVFSFFYTAVIFNPIEMADNMKKYGGVIMGVRPGKATAEYLNHVMTRITLVGSLFLVVVALLPNMLFSVVGVKNWDVVSFFGGTSLLIMVGVGLDTIKQMEQHLIMRNYEGFAKGRRIRSRRG
jgi:preprotein translocase subunit SecY